MRMDERIGVGVLVGCVVVVYRFHPSFRPQHWPEDANLVTSAFADPIGPEPPIGRKKRGRSSSVKNGSGTDPGTRPDHHP